MPNESGQLLDLARVRAIGPKGAIRAGGAPILASGHALGLFEAPAGTKALGRSYTRATGIAIWVTAVEVRPVSGLGLAVPHGLTRSKVDG